jgi:HK97 family phage portal protein
VPFGDRIAERIARAWLARTFPGQYVESFVGTMGAGIDDAQPYLTAHQKVQWISTCIVAKGSFAGMCPIRFYQIPAGKSIEDKVELPYNHSANVLFRSINPTQTAYQFRESVVGFLELTGNCFIVKTNRKAVYSGAPEEMWFLRPDRVKVFANADGTINRYEHTIEGKTTSYPPERIWHVKYFNPLDPLVGQGRVQALMRSINTDLAAQEHNYRTIKNNAQPRGAWVIKGVRPIDGGTRDRVELEKAHAGANRGRSALLYGDVDYKMIGFTNQEIEWLEGRKITRDEIISGMGCFPAIVGVAQADRSRAEADMRMFAQNTMVPIMTLIAESATEFLLPDFGPNLVALPDYSQIPAMQEDREAVARIVQIYTAGANPTLLPDEAREMFLHKEPRPDGNGDKVFISYGMVPAGEGGLVGPTGLSAASGTKSKRDAVPAKFPHTPAQALRWTSYARRLDVTESAARKIVAGMFEAQAAGCIASLNRSRSLRGPDDVVDDAELHAVSEKALKRVLLLAAAQGIEHGSEPLAGFLEISFTIDNPAVVNWVKANAYRASRFVDETTSQALGQIIGDALKAGKTLKEIEKDLRGYFDQSIAGRAKTIARTEVQHAVQHTQMEVWKDAGVVEGKEWLASMLPNGRHNEMHGQTVGLNERFVHPGGELCDAGTEFDGPGGSGLADQDINCACDVAPVVSAMSKMTILGKRLDLLVLPVKGKGSRKWETERNLKALNQ